MLIAVLNNLTEIVTGAAYSSLVFWLGYKLGRRNAGPNPRQ